MSKPVYYEKLDMEPIEAKKKWNLFLLIASIFIAAVNLIFVSEQIWLLAIQIVIPVVLMAVCIVTRKKYKIAIPIILNIIALFIQLLIALSYYINYVNMTAH